MSQQDQTSPPPASQPPSPPVAPVPKPPPATRGFWGRFTIPLFAVLAAFAFIALATLRWDGWVGSATVQTTNDAYVRAELTRLSSRVAGEVITVAVQDFQRVKAGDLLVQIDPADYAAFAQVYRRLHPRIREVAPETRVYVSFRWEVAQRSKGPGE